MTAGAKSDSITNNQITGVDEGDIVKSRGDLLLILRRGRLFSVSVAQGRLKTLDHIDAYPPGVDASGDWYDEMLISGDRVIVIGYSYQREGTQVNRFRVGRDGKFSFEDSYALRSGDYYSSRNYASRLIGHVLYVYSPLPLRYDAGDPLDSLPALKRWTRTGRRTSSWTRLAGASHVYAPRPVRDRPENAIDTLHTVTRCDVSAPAMACDSVVVLGGDSRSFFVSANAVYIWTVTGSYGDRRQALLYRVPLDASRPAAVGVRGEPVDQFSFSPDAPRRTLHVVVRSQGGGDAMWRPEVSAGDVALLDVPTADFGDGETEVSLNDYQPLPRPGNGFGDFQNRFVGDYLLYGAGGDASRTGWLTAVSLTTRNIASLAIPHAVDRIDLLGGDGIVVGEDAERGLGFTTIRLDGAAPHLGAQFRLKQAEQGESRSHAFFFHPDADSPDGSSGLLGLPITRSPSSAGSRLLGAAASVLFLRRESGELSDAGELGASAGAGELNGDRCQASCVDWYGNARPIFLGDRIFALLGYELVEGRFGGSKVNEVDRTDFGPGPRVDRPARNGEVLP